MQIADAEAAAVAKTPNRVSLDHLLSRISDEEFLHPRLHPHMTILVATLENGFIVIGQSTPADPANFNPELGMKFAKEDVIRQMWKLEAYLLRERMHLEEADGPSDVRAGT